MTSSFIISITVILMLVDYEVYTILFVVFLFMTAVASILGTMIINLEKRVERLEVLLNDRH